jgi:hypothetical protein
MLESARYRGVKQVQKIHENVVMKSIQIKQLRQAYLERNCPGLYNLDTIAISCSESL